MHLCGGLQTSSLSHLPHRDHFTKYIHQNSMLKSLNFIQLAVPPACKYSFLNLVLKIACKHAQLIKLKNLLFIDRAI